jgi:hypothetical protein
MKIICGSDT